MINFIEDMLRWFSIGFFIFIIGTILYALFKFYAKQSAELELQAQRDDLQRKNEDVKAQQKNLAESAHRAKKENDAFHASVVKMQKDVELAQQKAAETLVNAEKIKETAEIKVQQLQKENSKLQGDLTAARQRAKRLAKKIDTSA